MTIFSFIGHILPQLFWRNQQLTIHAGQGIQEWNLNEKIMECALNIDQRKIFSENYKQIKI